MVTQPILTSEDHARLTKDIQRAEETTSGEIYVVVAPFADAFRLVPILWGALFALILPWILFLATALPATSIFLFQTLGFVLVSGLLSLPQLRYRIVPSAIADDAVHRVALSQFLAHGIHLTDERTGVLLYVCMNPRRIEVIADKGIHSKVGQIEWSKSVDLIARDARAGRLADGLSAAIRVTGELLSLHFPRGPNDRNELPNRVVETQILDY